MTKIEQYWKSKNLLSEFRQIGKYVEARQIKYLNDLPPFSQNKVLRGLHLLRRMFPDKKVWLVGSYASGTYRDETTPREILKAFELLYKKTGYSDVDFFVEGINERIVLSDEAEIIPAYRSTAIKINDKI
jgi:predicted nucleotidyltransferase